MASELTEERKAVIRSNWELVTPDSKGNGVALFLKFFAAHPDYKNYFKDFKDKSEDELRVCPKLRAHGSIVIHNLTSIVENLDDLECALAIMKKIVGAHYPRGMRISHYEHLFKVFAEFLASALGPAFDKASEDAWGTVITVLTSVIAEHLDKLASELTDERKAVIRSNWELVTPDSKGNGVAFFLKFFAAHPDYKNYFKDFKGMSEDELRVCPKMRAHGSIVIHNLTSIVENLDDLECAVAIMKKIVGAHYPRGMRMSHYENLFKVFAEFLASALGPAFDKASEDAWGTVITVLTSITAEHLDVLAAGTSNEG